MRSACLLLAFVAVALTGADKEAKTIEVTAQDIIASRVVVIGTLGRPIGEMVTVRGTTVRPGKGDEVDIFVDSVNGKELRPRTTVQIDGIAHWPIGVEVEIRGQEKGILTFTDIRKTGAEPANHPPVEHQTLYLSFQGIKVISPRDLQIELRKR